MSMSPIEVLEVKLADVGENDEIYSQKIVLQTWLFLMQIINS